MHDKKFPYNCEKCLICSREHGINLKGVSCKITVVYISIFQTTIEYRHVSL